MASKPAKSVRCGTVYVAVWKDDKGDFISTSITVSKSYKDKNGDWKNTSSFRVNEIPDLICALQKVYTDIKLSGDTDDKF